MNYVNQLGKPVKHPITSLKRVTKLIYDKTVILGVSLSLLGCSVGSSKITVPFTRDKIKEIHIIELDSKSEVIVDDDFERLVSLIIGLSDVRGEQVDQINEPYYLLRVKLTVGEELIYLSGSKELILNKKQFKTEPFEELFDVVDNIYRTKVDAKTIADTSIDQQNIYLSPYLTIPKAYDWQTLIDSGMTSLSGSSYCNYGSIFLSDFHEMMEYCQLTADLIDEDMMTYRDIIEQIDGTKEILEQLKNKILTHIPHQENEKSDKLFELLAK